MQKKKKKIMFLIGSFDYGGVGKVLFDLVRSLDKNRYDITIISIFNKGLYKEIIPKEVKFKYILLNEKGIKSRIFNFLMYRYPKGLFYKLFIREKYDTEIAFMENYPTKVVAASPNKKSKKIAWIHTDLISNNFSDSIYDTFDEHKEAYEKFDNIICISDLVEKKFVEKFGENKNILKIENPIMIDEMLRKSEQIGFNDKNDDIKILTIGRLTQVKGQDIIVKVAKLLKNNGLKFRWYLIGDGDLRNRIKHEIIENNLEKNVILLGAKENPYPFLKQCDIYVQTSRVEGYCMALREAIVFKKPIITTNFNAASEQIINKYNGLITEFNEEKIYREVKKLIEDEDLRNYLSSNLKNNYRSLEEIMNDIYKLI